MTILNPFFTTQKTFALCARFCGPALVKLYFHSAPGASAAWLGAAGWNKRRRLAGPPRAGCWWIAHMGQGIKWAFNFCSGVRPPPRFIPPPPSDRGGSDPQEPQKKIRLFVPEKFCPGGRGTTPLSLCSFNTLGGSRGVDESPSDGVDGRVSQKIESQSHPIHFERNFLCVQPF